MGRLLASIPPVPAGKTRATTPTPDSSRRVVAMRLAAMRVVAMLVLLAGVGAKGAVVSLAALEVMTRIAFVHPLFEMVANLRVQLLLAALAITPVLVFVRSRLVALGVVLICISVVELAGFALARQTSAAADPQAQPITFMQYNVLATNHDYDAIAARINTEDPDVVVLSEITTAHLVEVGARLTSDYPYVLAEPWDDQESVLGGGLAILSRHPLREVPVPAAASPPHRSMLAATMPYDGGNLLVVGLHLPASRTDSDAVSLRDLQLTTTAELIRAHDGPAAVVGDLNLTPTSPLYRDFLDRVDWRDPHRSVGWQPTWSYRRLQGLSTSLPIDHVFVSNDLVMQRYVVGGGGGSDHNTLVVEATSVLDSGGSVGAERAVVR